MKDNFSKKQKCGHCRSLRENGKCELHFRQKWVGVGGSPIIGYWKPLEQCPKPMTFSYFMKLLEEHKRSE